MECINRYFGALVDLKTNAPARRSSQRRVNGDLAEYLVPLHADVPAIDAIMLEDFDERANHLGIKGIDELGTGGTGAAVADAVYNATGVRIRDRLEFWF
jgi:xanthine dehydrogenase YagR molybdenum-binding subunit